MALNIEAGATLGTRSAAFYKLRGIPSALACQQSRLDMVLITNRFKLSGGILPLEIKNTRIVKRSCFDLLQ